MSVRDYYSAGGRIRAQYAHATAQRTALLADALGSVTATATTSTAVDNTYRHRPHGSLLAKTGTGGDPSFLWNGELGYRKTGRTHADEYVRARHYSPSTTRWTTVDPLWPQESAYAYVDGNPINWTDASGAGDDDWLVNTANFFAGVGDSLTLGLTARFREAIGANDVINEDSGWYKAGEYVEMGTEIALTCGSAGLKKLAAKAVLEQGSTRAVRSLGLKTFRAAKKELVEEAVRCGTPRDVVKNMIGHHANPLFGHDLAATRKLGLPADTRALFPTGGLPPAWANAKWNIKLVPKAAHIDVHIKLLKKERLLIKVVNRYTITARAIRIAAQNAKQNRRETPSRGYSSVDDPNQYSGGHVIRQPSGRTVMD